MATARAEPDRLLEFLCAASRRRRIIQKIFLLYDLLAHGRRPIRQARDRSLGIARPHKWCCDVTGCELRGDVPVESTRSQNITVRCRRSPAVSGVGGAIACAVGGCPGCRTQTQSVSAKTCDRFEETLTVAEWERLASQGRARSAQVEHRSRLPSRGRWLRIGQGRGLGARPRHPWSRPCWSWLMIVQGRQPVQVNPPVIFPPGGLMPRIALGESPGRSCSISAPGARARY